jgi:hypothetical protein
VRANESRPLDRAGVLEVAERAEILAGYRVEIAVAVEVRERGRGTSRAHVECAERVRKTREGRRAGPGARATKLFR